MNINVFPYAVVKPNSTCESDGVLVCHLIVAPCLLTLN